MSLNEQTQFRTPFCAGLLAMMLPLLACGDVLTGTNGERFIGKVIDETNNTVVFESELAGPLTFSQSKIRDLQRAAPVELTNPPITLVDAYAASNMPSWKPPGVGRDGSDWGHLKSRWV